MIFLNRLNDSEWEYFFVLGGGFAGKVWLRRDNVREFFGMAELFFVLLWGWLGVFINVLKFIESYIKRKGEL